MLFLIIIELDTFSPNTSLLQWVKQQIAFNILLDDNHCFMKTSHFWKLYSIIKLVSLATMYIFDYKIIYSTFHRNSNTKAIAICILTPSVQRGHQKSKFIGMTKTVLIYSSNFFNKKKSKISTSQASNLRSQEQNIINPKKNKKTTIKMAETNQIELDFLKTQSQTLLFSPQFSP